MPSRRLALVRCKKGPWVSTHGVREPMLKVSGAKLDLVILVTQVTEGGQERYSEFKNVLDGLFPLESAVWMSVEIVQGPHSNVICEIISRRAA